MIPGEMYNVTNLSVTENLVTVMICKRDFYLNKVDNF